MKAPERIYLQAGLTEDSEEWDDELGVTWCVDRINDTDVEYVRRDIVARLWKALRQSGADLYYAVTHNAHEEGLLLAETAFLADSPEANDE